MGHEISQFDISDRQLFAGRTQAYVTSDIGEAKDLTLSNRSMR